MDNPTKKPHGHVLTSAVRSEENEFFLAEQEKLLGPKQKFDIWLDKLRRIPENDKIFFTQNLGIMLKSGLAAARALRTLALQADNRRFKRILFLISGEVEKGSGLARAMSAYPRIFEPIFVSMIKAGEQAGQLEEVLSELTRQMKKNHELKQKVKGALMYPSAILVAMVGIGIVMIIFVIPRMLSIFSELKAELPLPTRIFIALSNFINHNLLLLGLGALTIVITLTYALRTALGKKIWHAVVLKLPVVSSIVRKINLARIARTLGSMLKTEMPIVESVNLTGDVIKNVRYQNSIRAIAQAVEKGKTISSQMANYPSLYPPIIQQMVAVGEETGEIAGILQKLADFYEAAISQTTDSLPSLIEPILIIIMGIAVGGMAVSIILPMYSLSQAV